MQAGLLRRRITLQKPATTRGSAGEIMRNWVDVCTDVAAAIQPLSGRELFAAAQVQSSIDTKVTIRWRPGVISTMRVLHVVAAGSPEEIEIFNIEAVIADPTGRRWIELMCIQRQADGFQSDG